MAQRGFQPFHGVVRDVVPDRQAVGEQAGRQFQFLEAREQHIGSLDLVRRQLGEANFAVLASSGLGQQGMGAVQAPLLVPDQPRLFRIQSHRAWMTCQAFKRFIAWES